MTKEEINIFSRRITQSSRSELVVITYEIIENYIERAMEVQDDKEDFVFNMKKAKQFLNNVSSALDFSYDISKQLMSLYMYMDRCLISSIVKQTPVETDTVLSMLAKLKSSFVEISKLDKSGAVMQGGEQVYAGLTYGKGVLNEVAVRQHVYN